MSHVAEGCWICHFPIVWWNRSTLPNVMGSLDAGFLSWLPSFGLFISKLLIPSLVPANRAVYARPLSVNVDAGIPYSPAFSLNVVSMTVSVAGRYSGSTRTWSVHRSKR
ncbi:MAG: hypothetical protein KDB26_13010 [Microthrixaceae bacterium]|nr:hypothetical protein [Microthrixaceae bacterium]